MIDVRRLRILREVSRRGSLTAAAEALSYTPSAVSQHIAALEREVGVALVERGPRSVRVTDAGERLAREADVIVARLAAIEEEMRAIAGLRGGILRLGAFATAAETIAVDAMRLFAERHPAVELHFFEGDPEDCVPRLQRSELDLVLTYEYDLLPLPPVPSLRRVPLFDDPFRVVLPPGHRAAGRERVRLAALREEAWIAESRADCLHYAALACREAGFEPEVMVSTSDYRVAQVLVGRGVAVGLLPELALRAPPSGVVVREVDGHSFTRRIDATHRVGGERVPALQAMLAVLREVAGDYAAA